MKLKLILAAMCLISVLSACSNSNGSSSTPSDKGTGTVSSKPAKDTLTVAQDIDAGTLDPQKQGKIPDMGILINMFDTLVTRDENNKLAPSLATEWKALNDTTWEFKLREGVKFHDGEPFNADAVKFSIDRLNNPETKSPIVELKTVKEVVVVDAKTVKIITDGPDPILPNKMTLFGGAMVPPQYIKEKGDENFAKNPVGTGPFKFVSWQKDSQVTMEANADYWQGAAKFKKLVFKIIPNPSNMAAAIRAGEVDIASGIKPDVATQLKNQTDLKVVSSPGIRTFYISLDTKAGPLAKKEVRQALNYAIDVNTMIKTVLDGNAARASTLVPKENFGYDPAITPYEYNIEKAKQLLATAGYPDGFAITLDADNLEVNNVQVIAAQLEKIGVKVQLNLMDSKTLTANLVAKKTSPMYFIGNTGWTMDAMSNFQSYLKSDRRYNRYPNPDIDKLVDEEEQSIDPQKRQAAFTKLQTILKEDAPFIYLYQINGLYGIRNNIEWKPNPVGILSMYKASIK
ncbi:ABC transporter substrate-binding protein [Paenibacillus chondroitinus]|uniref:ABC transporter substrate-binding protein n=1 Tax=Paenibacillus chondroitinus TaxID=59842 RepID=A0ABU6D7N9_9BACL|nr:ABC transporter substrate-binding protein [Paenibacillus chondroitinus]MCY9661666.1 ABC transporter substrate-binding protein [Paenibacillus anseongense]MEB4793751.1 ABC transporter substrate-binding protein [Paenibacillus chondroitinus]